MDADTLCERISSVFQNAVYPGDDDIVPPGMKHDRLSADVVASFRGREWQSLSKDEVREHCDDLPLMSPAAFGYFLPAYMIHCVRTPLEVNTACTSVVHVLTPPPMSAEGTWKWWRPRVEVFDGEQCLAIVEFLEYEDNWEREDWAKMGRSIKKTTAAKASKWWEERAMALSGK